MFKKLKKLIQHPNKYFYDYFRKKLGFKKYFVTDKIKLLDAGNHRKWLKLLFSHPNLYLYYKFNKILRKPAYPILVNYSIKTVNESLIGPARGNSVALAVELENRNVVYFADPILVLKELEGREPDISGFLLKFSFQGSGNKVFIDAGVNFEHYFRIDLNGDNNYIYLEYNSSFCHNAIISMIGNHNTLNIYGNCKIMSEAKLIFAGDTNYAYIGPKTTIYPSSKINFNGCNSLAYFCGNQGIMHSVSLNNSNIFFHGGYTSDASSIDHAYHATEGKNILIGADCMFALGLKIITSDTHLIYDTRTLKRINNAKSIIIGDHVWIGINCRILKGAIIEDGCIVGAESIVTKHIQANCICAGSPAIIKKENVLWDMTNTINFNSHDINHYESYQSKDNIYCKIGYSKLQKIDDIESDISTIDKVKLINRILRD